MGRKHPRYASRSAAGCSGALAPILGHVGQSQSVEFHSLESCAEGAMHALGTKLGVSRVPVPGLCINA